MTEKEIRLRMAKLKLAFAQKELERTKILVQHLAASVEACDQDQLAVDLAQCEVDLASLAP